MKKRTDLVRSSVYYLFILRFRNKSLKIWMKKFRWYRVLQWKIRLSSHRLRVSRSIRCRHLWMRIILSHCKTLSTYWTNSNQPWRISRHSWRRNLCTLGWKNKKNCLNLRKPDSSTNRRRDTTFWSIGSKKTNLHSARLMSRNQLDPRTIIECRLILITGIGRKRGGRSRSRTGRIWSINPRSIQKSLTKCRWLGLMLEALNARKV